MQQYSVQGNCTLVDMYARVGSGSNQVSMLSSGSCFYYVYTVTVAGWHGAFGRTYSNFFDGSCGGTLFTSAQLGRRISCWLSPTDGVLVRVSPVQKASTINLAAGLALVISGSTIVLAFIIYTVYLCAVGRSFQSRRDLRFRRTTGNPINGEFGNDRAHEPFPAVQEETEGAWSRLFLNNDFAKRVLDRFAAGGGFEECSVCLEPLASPILWSCGHLLCETCSRRLWAASHDNSQFKCPVCRHVQPPDQLRRIVRSMPLEPEPEIVVAAVSASGTPI
jgi:hypothetical protein